MVFALVFPSSWGEASSVLHFARVSPVGRDAGDGCAENNGDRFSKSLFPIPQADERDF
jgi:hypothetical protein